MSMAKPPCPETWYRASDVRTLIDGHWVKRPKPTQAQRTYLRKCIRDGTKPDRAVYEFLSN